MSQKNANPATSLSPQSHQQPQVFTEFSVQPTGMVETTFAETLGLSMHNAILSQQNSQMIAQASITNACARLLSTPKGTQQVNKTNGSGTTNTSEHDCDGPQTPTTQATHTEQKQPKRLNIGKFFKRYHNKRELAEAAGALNRSEVDSVLDLGAPDQKVEPEDDKDGKS